MEDLKSMEEIRNELQGINFAKNEVEEKKEEPIKTETTATNIVEELHKSAMVGVVKTSEEVQNKIMDKARTSINNELEILDQKENTRKQEATYDANKEACENYGIDKSVPLWQIRLMKGGSAVWFVIYYIIATFTICPINVFCKGIKSFIKSKWIVILVGIIMYLLVFVGIPILVKYLNNIEI